MRCLKTYIPHLEKHRVIFAQVDREGSKCSCTSIFNIAVILKKDRTVLVVQDKRNINIDNSTDERGEEI